MRDGIIRRLVSYNKEYKWSNKFEYYVKKYSSCPIVSWKYKDFDDFALIQKISYDYN